MTDRSLVPKIQQIVQLGHGFEQLHAVCFVFQTFVDLQERHDAAVFPQQLGHRFAVNRVVHRAFEQDRAQNFVRGEIIGQNDPRAHVVHGLKHLGIARVIGRFNAIKAQRLGGRSARLVQCGHKSLPCFHLCALCVCRGHDDPGPY